MKFSVDPTLTRIIIIAVLIFLYSFVASSGIMATLQSRMPEPNEWLYYFLFAIGSDAVYMLTFLGVSVPETTKPS